MGRATVSRMQGANLFNVRGRELANTRIMAWYKGHVIIHSTAPPNTSRINMVVCGVIRSMMKESGLPYSFWMDALYTVHAN